MIGIPVPLFQITINLPFKQIHNDNHIFWLQRYNKNHIFGTFLPTFFTFPSIFLILPLILDYMFLHTIVVILTIVLAVIPLNQALQSGTLFFVAFHLPCSFSVF